MDHYFTNNQNLKSEIREFTYSYRNYEISFFSDNGVFSKNHIDYGSELLVKTFLSNYHNVESILDAGCGYGFIGITLSKVLQKPVTMFDVNKRAIHLASMASEKNHCDTKIIESNVYENIKDKFDVIISNPPVRAGKQILLDFLIGAKEHLNENGELWYVLRKDQGAKSIQKILNEHFNIQLVEKSKGFYIFCCKNH